MRNVLFLGALALAGCANLKPDYAAPTSGPIATVDIGETAGVANRRILVHGSDLCSVEQSKLVGIVKSKAIGVDTVERHAIAVEANKPVAISMPWANPKITGGSAEGLEVTTRYCQPVAVFTPVEGRRYRLDFAACSATLSEEGGGSRPASIYRGCDIGIPENDAARERMFYLRPRK